MGQLDGLTRYSIDNTSNRPLSQTIAYPDRHRRNLTAFSTAQNYDHQVLYDNKKMFKGEQDARISNLLKLGKDQISRLKEVKVGPPNMTLDQQLFAYRSEL